MKNKIFFGIAVFVVILSSSFYFTSKNRFTTLTSPEPVSVESSSTLIEKAKQAPGLSQPHLSEEEKSNAVCKPALESIETLPLNTLVYDLTNGSLALHPDCLFHEKNEFTMLKGFPQSCEVRVEGKPTQDCIKQLFFYKAMRVNRATIDQDLSHLPTEVIIQKLVAILGSFFDGVTPEVLKQLSAVGAQLRERLPESASAHKAALLGVLANDNATTEEKVRYQQELNQSRQKFPNDWDLFEMDLIQKKKNDKEEYNKEVQIFYGAHPKSAIALYHRGCLSWSQGQAAEAQDFFKQALDIAPNDTRFKDTYQKSLTSATADTVCSVQLNFDPDRF
jgi:tetratricopeptide (TPR) repeat protein